jgi:hypothetical protein
VDKKAVVPVKRSCTKWGLKDTKRAEHLPERAEKNRWDDEILSETSEWIGMVRDKTKIEFSFSVAQDIIIDVLYYMFLMKHFLMLIF